VPAWLISLFLTDYTSIFNTPQHSASPLATTSTNPDMGLGSPRQQIFSDALTPACNQTTFPPAPGFQLINQQPPTVAKSQRNTFAPLSSSMASDQTAPHNEYAGPQQQIASLAHQSYHPPHSFNFPHPAALSISHPVALQPNHVTNIGNPTSYGQQTTNSSYEQPPAQRRKNRESAMMGMNIGLVGQRSAPRQTLKDANSSSRTGIY
jgi:hypothetical protein